MENNCDRIIDRYMQMFKNNSAFQGTIKTNEKRRIEYGNCLKELRCECGYTQVDLCEIAGFANYNNISEIEHGKYPCSAKRIHAYSTALKIDEEVLLQLAGYTSDNSDSAGISLLELLRKRNNLSQEQLAIKVKYANKTSINRIEKGQGKIPQSKKILFAEVLNVPLETIEMINKNSADYIITKETAPSVNNRVIEFNQYDSKKETIIGEYSKVLLESSIREKVLEAVNKMGYDELQKLWEYINN